MRDALAAALFEVGRSKREEYEGCTEAQVAEVEASFGRPLPASYREFLLAAGQWAGDLFKGTDILFPRVVELNDGAVELLAEGDSDFSLPPDAFVFLMHQGYQFMFFRATEGDDPPVYHYHEGDDAPRRISDSFSNYMLDCIEEYRGQS